MVTSMVGGHRTTNIKTMSRTYIDVPIFHYLILQGVPEKVAQ